MKQHTSASAGAGIAGLVLGLALSASWSAGEVRDAVGELSAIPSVGALDAVPAMPRTRLLVAMDAARSSLERNRPWAAWKELADHVEDPAGAPASATLLAARAAAGWGGWSEVRRILAGREWLEREEGGEGLFLLARAYDEAERWDEAGDAYRRYAALPEVRSRATALARLGRVLREQGRHRDAAAAFGAAAAR
ncbi:MAG TPA: hypothetical protein VHG51_19055, partial [Longimicrobiaceae bacterium]|nr:hypothetical protein [Longimicrobiaceae bacterium]